MKVGIIGYGYVGQAVAEIINEDIDVYVVDPIHTPLTVRELIDYEPNIIFVCVPTPANDFSILERTLKQLEDYKGVTVVKSTVLPRIIDKYNVVYNPEFLSRSTALHDIQNPQLFILGGHDMDVDEVYAFFYDHTSVNIKTTYFTSLKMAAMIKYTLNSFFSLKVSYMNMIHDVCEEEGVNYSDMAQILEDHPWIGPQHLKVPGTDGKRGFGGPCLPKDTETFSEEYGLQILQDVLKYNEFIRNELEWQLLI